MKFWYKYTNKVKLCDELIRQSFFEELGCVASFIAVPSMLCQIPENYKNFKTVFVILLIMFFFYLYIWLKANLLQEVSLKIKQTKVNIYCGNIFNEAGLKIIGVNNYIDLIADDDVIAKKSLHGKFLLQNSDKIEDIKKAIKTSKYLKISKESNLRKDSDSYETGGCVNFEDYILTVLTEFNERNEAYTTSEKYITFWMRLWDNLDSMTNGKSVYIPLLGAGRTRYEEHTPTKQEILEMALATMKFSRYDNTYSDASVNFVIYEGDFSEINLYAIKKKYEK